MEHVKQGGGYNGEGFLPSGFEGLVDLVSGSPEYMDELAIQDPELAAAVAKVIETAREAQVATAQAEAAVEAVKAMLEGRSDIEKLTMNVAQEANRKIEEKEEYLKTHQNFYSFIKEAFSGLEDEELAYRSIVPSAQTLINVLTGYIELSERQEIILRYYLAGSEPEAIATIKLKPDVSTKEVKRVIQLVMDRVKQLDKNQKLDILFSIDTSPVFNKKDEAE